MRVELEEIQRIEAYLSGNLTVEEQLQFEKAMAADPKMKEQVDFQNSFIEGLQRAGLKADAKRAYTRYKLRRAGIITSITVLLMLGLAGAYYLFNLNNSESVQVFCPCSSIQKVEYTTDRDVEAVQDIVECIDTCAVIEAVELIEIEFPIQHETKSDSIRSQVVQMPETVNQIPKNSNEKESSRSSNNTTEISVTDELTNQAPTFIGGFDGLSRFINNEMRYPRAALERGIEGVVHVTFTVDESGAVVKPKIHKSVHPLLDQEAMRVVGLMPNWKPAIINGKAQTSFYTLPIEFSVDKTDH